MKLTKNTIKQIMLLIGDVISLNNIEEFDPGNELFKDPPEFWNDSEKEICDYQNRISFDLIKGLENIFDTEFYKKRKG